jgi:arsenate reductase-like glutaredoxin family protein
MAQKKAAAPKQGMSNAQKAGIGFGLTAAAVSAAGAYFLYGSKKASQNRKKVKGWMLKAKGEVLEALEKAEHITADEYKQLVKTASGAYTTVKNASSSELKDFQKEMGQHWDELQKSKALKKLAAPAKEMVAKAEKALKKPAKKVAKKK